MGLGFVRLGALLRSINMPKRSFTQADPTSAPGTMGISGLPNELLAQIFGKLTLTQMTKSQLVCKRWHSLLKFTISQKRNRIVLQCFREWKPGYRCGPTSDYRRALMWYCPESANTPIMEPLGLIKDASLRMKVPWHWKRPVIGRFKSHLCILDLTWGGLVDAIHVVGSGIDRIDLCVDGQPVWRTVFSERDRICCYLPFAFPIVSCRFTAMTFEIRCASLDKVEVRYGLLSRRHSLELCEEFVLPLNAVVEQLTFRNGQCSVGEAGPDYCIIM